MAELRRARLHPRLLRMAIRARDPRRLMRGVRNLRRVRRAPLALGRSGQAQRIRAERIISHVARQADPLPLDAELGGVTLLTGAMLIAARLDLDELDADA